MTENSNTKHLRAKHAEETFDRQLIIVTELADTSGQNSLPCDCGFIHLIKADGTVDKNVGYNEKTKEFEMLHSGNGGSLYFFEDHPYRYGKY